MNITLYYDQFIRLTTSRRFAIYLLSLMGFLMSVLPNGASAKTVVFIHGLMEDSMSWQQSGVTRALHTKAWVNGGHYFLTPNGVTRPTHTIPTTVNAYYAVNLPDKSAIIRQSQVLDLYLNDIYTKRKQPLLLVAHSAGGLVARYWLVIQQYKSKPVPVAGLMTIATPHLGTPLAKYARLGSRFTPDSFFDRYSNLSPILRDLRPEKDNRLLAWLNHQPHPMIAYAAIIRRNKLSCLQKSMGRTMDMIVPPYRQDMNNVYALRGRAMTLRRNRGHDLVWADGWDILNWLRQFK